MKGLEYNFVIEYLNSHKIYSIQKKDKEILKEVFKRTDEIKLENLLESDIDEEEILQYLLYSSTFATLR